MYHVRLSRRNLLALLHKLEMKGSAATIQKPDGGYVTVESDEVHYAGREHGPGVMHPETEKFVAEMTAALDQVRRKNEPHNTVADGQGIPLWVQMAAREIHERFCPAWTNIQTVARVINHYAKEAL